MKLVSDFINKLAPVIRSTYFPDVKFYMDNKNCAKAFYAMELMSNGCLTYPKLIERLSKATGATKDTIHGIVSMFVADFEGYEYPTSEKIYLAANDWSIDRLIEIIEGKGYKVSVKKLK